jgi:hypothetical protein
MQPTRNIGGLFFVRPSAGRLMIALAADGVNLFPDSCSDDRIPRRMGGTRKCERSPMSKCWRLIAWH